MSTSYPGPDPDDPFAKPPNESGRGADPAGGQAGGTPAYPGTPSTPSPTEETAPIQPGYWERLAQQGQPGQQGQQGQQADPPTTPYGTQPPGAQAYPPAYGDQPGGANPWAGYGQPAASSGASTPPPESQPYPPAYGYAQPAYTGYAQPQQPQATTAMVLGLVGLIGGFLTCGLLFLMSPFAWAVGARSRREIAASNGQLGGQGNAQAGFVMGIIGTVLLVLAIVAVVLFIGLIVAGTSSGSYDSTTNF